MKFSRLFLSAFLTFGMLAAAVPASAQSDMDDRLNQLETKMNTIERAVYKGGAVGDSVPDSHSAEPGTMADIQVRLGQLEEKIRQMNGTLEELEHKIQQTGQQQDAGAAQRPTNIIPPAAASSSGAQSAALPAVVASPRPADAGIAPSSGHLSNPAQDDYDRAFNLLKQEKYEEAVQSFKAFIAAYPTHVLNSNAYYWLGESYYAQQHYEQAAVQFLEGYKQFPKGGKAADSLLKLGMSLGQVNKKAEACATLGKLTSEFPDASSALKERIRQERTEFQCH